MSSPANLDIHANNVSPPALVTSNRQQSHAQAGDNGDRGLSKIRRHQLRRTSASLLPGERVKKCGQQPVGTTVTLHATHTGHHFAGVETCGSVWHCPVCAAKITEGRREEIDAVLESHRKAGGAVYMMTLTIPHHRMQTCEELRHVVRDVWRFVKQGSPWKRAKAKFGYLGDVRAMEVTHGHDGWHPHLHILVFMHPDATEDDAEQLGFYFFDRWARSVERKGYGQCSADAFTFDRVTEDSGAAEYVGKWGASLELTKAHTKLAGNGGRTPWQILDDCHRHGSKRDKALFREYAHAFKGARQLTWGGDIRHRYDNSPEATDEELAASKELPETHIATLGNALWKHIRRQQIIPHVLVEADQADGVEGVIALLRAQGLDVIQREHQSLELGRRVPFLDLAPPSQTSPGIPPGTCPGTCPGSYREPYPPRNFNDLEDGMGITTSNHRKVNP
ncbi:MAG: protein rep [Alphaproteobacteria bacterium]|nr:protein rep [Alphaproteobacteria bacterium SS10]